MDKGFLNLHDGSNFLDSDLQVDQKVMISLFHNFVFSSYEKGFLESGNIAVEQILGWG